MRTRGRSLWWKGGVHHFGGLPASCIVYLVMSWRLASGFGSLAKTVGSGTLGWVALVCRFSLGDFGLFGSFRRLLVACQKSGVTLCMV